MLNQVNNNLFDPTDAKLFEPDRDQWQVYKERALNYLMRSADNYQSTGDMPPAMPQIAQHRSLYRYEQ